MEQTVVKSDYIYLGSLWLSCWQHLLFHSRGNLSPCELKDPQCFQHHQELLYLEFTKETKLSLEYILRLVSFPNFLSESLVCRAWRLKHYPCLHGCHSNVNNSRYFKGSCFFYKLRISILLINSGCWFQYNEYPDFLTQKLLFNYQKKNAQFELETPGS